jgi:predicted ATPase
LLRFEAVALFVGRTQTHIPSFVLTADNATAVAHICSRLDGIPLALEMAAARVNVFTVEELARRLDGAFDARFQLLTSGARTAPQRQQTLRATLEWSYALLTPAEQRLLTRLSVFSGGWTATAVEAVANAECRVGNAESSSVDSAFRGAHWASHSALDVLVQLVNKSLVITNQQAGQTRYRLLETVRQFAAEQGATDKQEHRQAQHCRYYLALLGEQEGRLQSHEQHRAVDTIHADFENMRVAWRWAVQQREFTWLAPALHALFLFCDIRGNFSEGVILFSAAAAELGAALAVSATEQLTLQSLWAQVQIRLGACEVMVSNYVSGEQHLQNGLQYTTLDRERAFTLAYLGAAASERGELALAHTHLYKSLAISQQCNDEAGMACALYYLHIGALDYAETCRLCTESLALWHKVGRPDRITTVLNMLAWCTFCLGDYGKANAYWQEGLERCEQLDLPNDKAWVLDCLGFSAWCTGELALAERYIQEALAIYTALGRQLSVGMCMAELALVLSSRGQGEQAIALARQAVVITRDINGQMMLTLSLNYLGAVLIAAGDFEEARQTLREAIQRAWKHQYFYNVMTAFYYFAELLVQEEKGADLPMRAQRRRCALELLSCVRTQPVTWQIFKDKAAQLQAQIEGALSADMRAIAIQNGQSRTLAEMVSTLLRGEPDTLSDDPKVAL